MNSALGCTFERGCSKFLSSLQGADLTPDFKMFNSEIKKGQCKEVTDSLIPNAGAS